MIEIIPAIDLIDGKCVRLTRGDFAQKRIYSDDPVATAKGFEDAGLKRLHIVDLDGARTGTPANTGLIAKIARETDLIIDFGGGVRTTPDVRSVMSAGARMVNVGSVAMKDPELFISWLDEFGSDAILLGADTNGDRIAINGWQTKTAVELIPFLRENVERGVTQAFVTDISKDGLLEGPATEIYREIRRVLPGLKIIASGGVTSFDDIDALQSVGCSGVIIGKAIYEGRIKLDELSRYLCLQNV